MAHDADMLIEFAMLVSVDHAPAVTLRERRSTMSDNDFCTAARRIVQAAAQNGGAAPNAPSRAPSSARGALGRLGSTAGGGGRGGGGTGQVLNASHAAADAPAGFIFFASKDTVKECLSRSLFGLPSPNCRRWPTFARRRPSSSSTFPPARSTASFCPSRRQGSTSCLTRGRPSARVARAVAAAAMGPRTQPSCACTARVGCVRGAPPKRFATSKAR